VKPFLDLPGPWLIAHRGGAALAPENTLPAFDRAAALGAACLELGHHAIDFLRRLQVVREREPGKAGTLRGHTDVCGEMLPRVQGEPRAA